MYINTQTLQYLVSEQDIRLANPNTSFGLPFVAPETYAWVFPAPEPLYDNLTQTIREITPILTTKGTWEQQWEIIPKFTEYTDLNGILHTVSSQIEEETLKISQIAGDQVRKTRNTLLNESDWTQISDSPVSKEPWIAYRQQLRDITLQIGFPYNIIWPEKPQ